MVNFQWTKSGQSIKKWTESGQMEEEQKNSKIEFNSSNIKRYIKSQWLKESVDDAEWTQVSRIHPDAVALCSEYLRLFTLEVFHRAQDEATVEEDSKIEPKHIEQIVSQVLLDF